MPTNAIHSETQTEVRPIQAGGIGGRAVQRRPRLSQHHSGVEAAQGTCRRSQERPNEVSASTAQWL